MDETTRTRRDRSPRPALHLWRTTGLCAVLIGGLSLGCSRPNAPDNAPPAAAAPASTPKAGDPAPPSAPVKPDPSPNYTLRVIPGEAKAGEPATSIIEVTPAPGYKMNLEFPSRVKVDAPTGAALAPRESPEDGIELTEAALKFKVDFTPSAAGALELAGKCDFSVCNENACKLIRDEAVAWKVNVD